MTAALHDPHVFVTAVDFATKFPQFEIETENRGIEKQVLIIGLKLRMSSILLLVLADWIFSLVIGIILGCVTKSVDVGVSAAAAVVTLVSCGLGLFFSFSGRS